MCTRHLKAVCKISMKTNDFEGGKIALLYKGMGCICLLLTLCIWNAVFFTQLATSCENKTIGMRTSDFDGVFRKLGPPLCWGWIVYIVYIKWGFLYTGRYTSFVQNDRYANNTDLLDIKDSTTMESFEVMFSECEFLFLRYFYY